MARWQSGDAADCKSVYVGSIPARASILNGQPRFGGAFCWLDVGNPARKVDRLGCRLFIGPQLGNPSMFENAQTQRIQRMTEALRSIIAETASARSALCENELVIRLDNVLALARAALDDD